jgi:transcriptional regulator with XRE-family HTH domain
MKILKTEINAEATRTDLGKQITERRESLDLPIKQLSYVVKTDSSRISNLERGNGYHIDLLIEVVEALGGKLKIEWTN